VIRCGWRAGGGLDVDGEGGFFHAELLYPLFDVAGECRCGFLPGGAECSGFGVVVGFGGAAGGFEFAAALVFLRECLVQAGEGTGFVVREIVENWMPVKTVPLEPAMSLDICMIWRDDDFMFQTMQDFILMMEKMSFREF